MGVNLCCCQAQREYAVKPLDQNDIQSSVESPVGADAKASMSLTATIHQTEPDLGDATDMISTAYMCDHHTKHLCDTVERLVHVLSLYHIYVHEFNEADETHGNLLKKINRNVDDYDLIQLRDDYHHIVSYHEDNKYFMKLLFAKLMTRNREHDIQDLDEINAKLDRDSEKQFFFGHKMSDEIPFLTTLNQVHYDCTRKFNLKRKKSKQQTRDTNDAETVENGAGHGDEANAVENGDDADRNGHHDDGDGGGGDDEELSRHSNSTTNLDVDADDKDVLWPTADAEDDEEEEEEEEARLHNPQNRV